MLCAQFVEPVHEWRWLPRRLAGSPVRALGVAAAVSASREACIITLRSRSHMIAVPKTKTKIKKNPGQ